MAVPKAPFLITGSTDGIGLHTALKLARDGATVLVHGRDPQRVAAAVERCRAAAGGGAARVHGYIADLSELAQVRELAAAVRRDHGAIGTLINNAGQGGRAAAAWRVECAAPRTSSKDPPPPALP